MNSHFNVGADPVSVQHGVVNHYGNFSKNYKKYKNYKNRLARNLIY